MLQSQLYEVAAGERGAIMFLQILGMTLIVIGLVGFLVSMGAIFYHLFRAQRGEPRQPQSPRAGQQPEVEP